MSNQMNLPNTLNVISSPASAGGRSLCNSQAGPQLDLFGQALAPASHSQPLAKASEPQTNGTSGPCSSISSASAALSLSLGNRLQTRLAKAGSTEYQQTWKQKATPAGRPYWAHTASGHRTSDKDCSGWPTPSDDNANNAYGHKGTDFSDLPTTAQKASGQPPSGTPAATAKPAALNPAFSLWLMGYPAEWASCGARAMQSSRKSRRSS